MFGIKSGTFQSFFLFKGSRKPNRIQTICQWRFDIWDYTFSRRVKVFRHSFWETIPIFFNHPKSDFILVRIYRIFYFSRRVFAKHHPVSSWCWIVSSRSRWRKIWILSISKFFFIVVIVISILQKTAF